MKKYLHQKNNDADTLSVCICDDAGVHYPCPTCGKLYDDEMDALFCCLEKE